jgi:5'-nucleotidase
VRILVTNDDGVDAPGVATVGHALRSDGHDVLVAAPLRDWSGTGAALGPVHVDGRIRYRRLGVGVVGVDGPPALAVVVGCLGAFGPRPDLVVSGINAGPNLGQAVLHSGTVGAALTALSFGVSALAVSVALPACRYDGAALVACALATKAARRRSPAVLNVNVPDCDPAEWRGVRLARLARAGVVEARVAEHERGMLQLTFQPALAVEPETDVALLHDGWVTATPLTGVGQDSHAGWEPVEHSLRGPGPLAPLTAAVH